MKIRWHGMLGTLHSWSIVSQALVREIAKKDHQVFLKSTNSLEHFPNDLKKYLLPGYHDHLQSGKADYITKEGQQVIADAKNPLPEIEDINRPYDLELAYTIFFQTPRRFFAESRARAVIWNYESSLMPPGWGLYTRAVDYVLPSSQFSYDIFAQNGVPKDKMIVVPHGVDTNIFNKNIPPFKLNTEKKVKFLMNAIPHSRKLFDRVFKAYLDTFTGNDDVCLVLKTKFLTPGDPSKPFEVDVKKMLAEALQGRKNPAEIEIINDTFIEDIGSLYTACDCVVCMSSTEGFALPLEEALACGTLVIAPRYGGQLDFLNDSNSLLVDTKEMIAPATHQYWQAQEGAVVGDPDTRHCAELMRYVYENLDKEKARVKDAAEATVKKFSWEAAANIILSLPIPATSKRFYNRKKILYIIPYNMAGGAEVWVKEAINKLDKNIFEAHVAFVSGGSKELYELFNGIHIEDLKDKGCLAGLKCLIEAENYSLIHFHNSFSVYQTLKETWRQGYRCRIVETVHSDLVWNDSMTKIASREPFVCAISAVSNTMGKKLTKLGNKNVTVMPQQVDWNRFNIAKSKDILGDIPKDFVVGFVGRLSPEKNLHLLLKCASALPNVSFVIVGDGPQRQVLSQLTNGLKNVFFFGNRSDVEKFYSAFDVLMLPSIIEGLPLVILEAMVAGVPSVASNVGAISEIIQHGFNGFLANPNDGLTFINYIKQIQDTDGLLEKLSENCKKSSTIYRDWGNTANINTLYGNLFGGRR